MIQQPDFGLDESGKLLFRAIAATGTDARIDIVRRLFDLMGEDEAFAFAEANLVGSHLGHVVVDHPELSSNPERWVAAHTATSERIDSYMRALDDAAAALSKEGIPMVALKNSGITRGIYTCHGCSPMGDLDVLVRRDDFRTAHTILTSRGFQFKFRSPDEEAEIDVADREGGSEFCTTLPTGERLWFELQWRPVSGRWIQPDQEPSAEDLVSRSIPMAGTEVRLLEPVDNLLQVALHTAKHSYVRAPGFRLHTDVDRLVRFTDIDWDQFVKEVRRLRVQTAVFFSLYIPARFMDTPVPSEVLDALSPPKRKARSVSRQLKSAGLLFPEERKFSKVSYTRFALSLYDSSSEIWSAVFPPPSRMKSHYGFSNDLLLPVYYLRRLGGLARKAVR